MRLRRLVDLSDPTFLAVSLSLVFISFSPTPWGWSCVRPDFRLGWVYLWGAQAMTTVALHPKRRAAWISLAVAVLFTAPVPYVSDESFGFALIGSLLSQITFPLRALRPLLWWGILMMGYALSLRAAFPGTGWLRPLAATVIATVASLGVRVAPEFLGLGGAIYSASPNLAKIHAILVYLSPAIVLPAILWRAVRWSDTLLFLLLAAAAPLLSWMTVCNFRAPRRPVDVVLAVLVALSGTLIAWLRLAWQPGPARGFDVISIDAVESSIAR